MIKKSNRIYYEYKDVQCSIKKILGICKKRPGRSKYLLSVNVMVGKDQKIPAKIVCVRNKKNRKEWIALYLHKPGYVRKWNSSVTRMNGPLEKSFSSLQMNCEYHFRKPFPNHHKHHNKPCLRCLLAYRGAIASVHRHVCWLPFRNIFGIHWRKLHWHRKYSI